MLRILGIDPGIARLGFAILELNDLQNAQLLDCGVIETCKSNSDALRLQEIREDLKLIIEKYQPNYVAIEKLFFFKNPKTIIPVAQARGVCLEISANFNLPIFEFTPLEMKKIITGNGMAKKDLVSSFVHQSLNLNETIKPDDAVDAVGMALAFCRTQMPLLAQDFKQSLAT